ncbi:rod shape-determining protein RodA [Marivivens donghaensis]|uniref:Peptidoglycan glycosyltransferase MrdB n=1 Tax=Marivivens donghaensis TaxID=1699413 RepID=A0ABX0W059_9RHOB|nr:MULTISPECIES: rod shape-determining protein RodA [Marivivens]NIY73733.1 rod shape-determining protein RodA [Marivivens donghaensis]
MSLLESSYKNVPTGIRKLLYVNWAIVLLTIAIACAGFLMLYSVAGGSVEPWLDPQLNRFGFGLFLMIAIGMVPIWFWRNVSAVGYIISLLLLVAVELFGEVRMGAQRWINLGFMVLQPSELAKITLVMFLAAYYDWLPLAKRSRPLWIAIPLAAVLVPTFLVFKQPDLGTALLLAVGGGTIIWLAGVHWAYFAVVVSAGIGTIWAVFESKGTSWQLLKDYQYDRINIFLDPSQDPLGAGYHITQAKIALGSGGVTGRGFMQGTQSGLDFLPEAHTDFIFTTLAEEFGFIGATTLLALYLLLIGFCFASALQNRDRFSSLLTLGISMTFFLYFAVNMAMVMGLAPVVGVPLPLVSYGGSAMLVLMVGFGLVQSAHIHRPR